MRVLGLGLLLAAPSAAVAQDAPHLWAVAGLYGLERSACAGTAGDSAAWDGAMVAPIFCPSLDEAHRVAIGQRFAAAVARAFPQVETRFAESLPADATARAKLAHTLVASLRLTRATVWRLEKPAGLDAYLPITLTLQITNAATGEVVFTRTRSDVAQGTFPADGVDAALVAQFDARLDATLQTLVAEAAAAWKPWAQQAVVVAADGDRWIIDKGRSHGLRTDDAIGADGRILYAAANYAVVQPTLGRYRTGQVLARTAVAPAELLAKPSVLVAMDALPKEYAAPYLSQIFEDALGTRANFAPMPVNPGFSDLRQRALGEAQAAAMAADARSLPDYVASVSIAALPSVRFASNVPGVTLERHEAHAFVSLVDQTGRVVATFHGTGRIQDEVAGGMHFSPEQRRDTVVRNALLDAAAAMARFRPQAIDVPIVAERGAMLVRDTSGALPSGAQVTVLRDIGTIQGIAGRVRVPVGEVTTGAPVPGGLAASDAGATALILRGGETVTIEHAGEHAAAPLTSRLAAAQCTDPDGGIRVEDRGPLAVPVWALAANASFAGRYGGVVQLATLPSRLAALGAEFSGWRRFPPARQRTPDYCFVPVLAVTPAATGYDLTVGFKLMRGDQKLVGSGLRSVLTPTRLPAGTAAEDVAAMLQHDLAAQLPVLADKAAAALKPAQ